jgi:hypothetical protein
MVFRPTYLYIKQHTITGKLYFGKCQRTEVELLKYKGSGIKWKSHIKHHGIKYVTTLWYELYDNIFDLVADAISMSKSFNIVNNESWMNLILENGLDWYTQTNHPRLRGKSHPMFGRKHSEKTRKIISEKCSGKNNSNYGKTGDLNHNYGRVWGVEWRESHKNSVLRGEDNPMYGKIGELSPHYGKGGVGHHFYGKCGESSHNYGKIRSLKNKKKISTTLTILHDFMDFNGNIIKNVSMKEFSNLVNANYNSIKSIFNKQPTYRGYTRLTNDKCKFKLTPESIKKSSVQKIKPQLYFFKNVITKTYYVGRLYEMKKLMTKNIAYALIKNPNKIILNKWVFIREIEYPTVDISLVNPV